ncbi:MAG: eukaryotic-like serine/threonine-protein kinase [Chloroflexota bacterium]|jgi:predicted Ser/Thr protein kinase|nr:eukaryotic-like serine/threonine-protein kinase [Chloroflexota bacterium]
MAMAMAMATRTGEELAGYELVRELGRGAMGTVYLGRQVALGRDVAIKQLLGSWSGDEEFLDRFRREGRALARMNHENIVGVYDMTHTGIDVYLVMEYIAGVSLGTIVRRGEGLDRGQALSVIQQVSAALDYAAGCDILHRDLKPDNVLVTEVGTVKVVDFGLTKMLSEQSKFVTSVGTVMGTPAYMSPEQASGSGAVDARSDVYTLGVMAYELLTGSLPFTTSMGEVDLLEAHRTAIPPRPDSIVPGFPQKVADVLVAALEKDPGRRPQTAGELWSRLEKAATAAWPGWRDEASLAGLAVAARPRTIATSTAHATRATRRRPVESPATVVDADAPVEQATRTRLQKGAGTRVQQGTGTRVQQGTGTRVRQGTGTRVQQGTGTRVRQGTGTRVQQAGGTRVQHHAGTRLQPASATRLGAPEDPALRTRSIELPVYTPVRPARSNGRLARVGLAALLVVLVGAAGTVLYLRFGNQVPASAIGPSAPAALQVTAVTLALEPGAPEVGRCPSAAFRFISHIRTNGGAGELKYQWIAPDGTAQPTRTATLQANQVDVESTFEFDYAARKAFSGKAILRVLAPNTMDSAPVAIRYTCG